MRTFTDLRNWKNDESVEPEAFKRPKVVSGDGTCVPYQLPATDHQRFPRDVRQPKLQPQVAEMNGVDARAQHRHDGRQPAVHVEARSTTSANRQRVEEKRVDRQGHPTRQKERAVPLLHALAAGVEYPTERAGGPLETGCRAQAFLEVGSGVDWDQGSSSAGFPLRLVGLVARGGVEHRSSHTCAGVAFDGAGDWAVVVVVVAVAL